MKRRHLLWLGILLMTLGLTACVDDDDPPQRDVLRVQRQAVLITDLPWICGPYPEVLLNGLSPQLIDEINCIEPGVMEHFTVSTTPRIAFSEMSIGTYRTSAPA